MGAMSESGVFTVSLDFEFYWGVHDKRTLASFKPSLGNIRSVIEETLALFEQYEVHATWATVGFLFSANPDELRESLPQIRPRYAHQEYSPYDYVAQLKDPNDNEFLFAKNLIKKIAETPNQEIATHTMSHLYLLEDGVEPDDVHADLSAAIQVAAESGIKITSIVFPRNQFSEEGLEICKSLGINCYRGNQSFFAYNSLDNAAYNNPIRKLTRLLDCYVNLSGSNTYSLQPENNEMLNVPASFFLRPYSKKLQFLEGFRSRRLKSAMTKAAKKKEIFHLWWHPHNFGLNSQKNLQFLEGILKHYRALSMKHGMASRTMSELSSNYTGGVS